MPVSFTVMSLFVREDEGQPNTISDLPEQWTWDTAADYFWREKERRGLKYVFDTAPQFLTHAVLNENFEYFYDRNTGKYDLNAPVIRETLTTVKRLCDGGLLWNADLSGFSAISSDDGSGNTLFMETVGLVREIFLHNSISDYGEIYRFPLIRGTEGMAARLHDEYAINASSRNKEAAWEFIKILLSDDIQNSAAMQYQPVLAEMNKTGVRWQTGGGINTSDTEVAEYNRARFSFYSAIDRIYGPDGADDITGLIYEQSLLYYKGEASLDEVILNIIGNSDTDTGDTP